MASLVSIGVPVRNGAKSLALALDSLLSQDYENLEIIISDNASDDDTALICQKYEKFDKRINYFRQNSMISAFDNFQFVLKESSGDFFMWAAHDDTRESNYVSCLMKGFQATNDTILTFSDLYINDNIQQPYKKEYTFDSTKLILLDRLLKTSQLQCFHIYGLWKISLLRNINFKHTYWWPDMPIMMCASYLGTFKYISGTKFIYTEVVKSTEKRISYQEVKKVIPKFLILKLTLTVFITLHRTSNSLCYALIGSGFVFLKRFPEYIYSVTIMSLVHRIRKQIF